MIHKHFIRLIFYFIAFIFIIFIFITPAGADWTLQSTPGTCSAASEIPGATCTSNTECVNGTCDMNQLRAVWGASGTEVFAVGEYGTILHTTDSGVTWNLLNSVVTQTIYGVWGNSGSDVFIAADSGKIYHYDGSNWSSMTSPVTSRLRDVWCVSGNDVFVVGENGVILHYNGTAWSVMTSPTTLTLQGVWGTAGNNVFAVGGPSASSGGDRGTILKYNGVAWTKVWNDPSILRFHDLWGSSDTNLFAVGEAGAIVHSTNGGATWEVMNNPAQGSTVTLRDIWGSSESDIFAVGDGDSATDYGSTILHYDGSTWSIMCNPLINNSIKLHGLWGSSGENVFAVGDRYVEPDGITTHWTIMHFTDSNSPPGAAFTITPSTGDTATVFNADASRSCDDVDQIDVLQIRWDWENDGSWDTDYSTEKTAAHQFSDAGDFIIKLEVKDTGGLVNTALKKVTVTEPPSTTSTSTTTVPKTSSTTSLPALTTTTTVPQTTTSITSTTTSSSTSTTSSIISTTSSSTSTTTTAFFCACTKIFNSENSHEVKLLREYRNRRLAKSLTGIRLIYLYYAHSPELTNLLSLQPELFARAAAISAELIPSLQKGLQNNTGILLTRKQLQALRHLLLDVKNEASPRFKNAIDFILKKLNSEKFLKTIGVTVIR